MSPATARLAIRNASKTFGRIRVLDNVELRVDPGQIHGLVGQNGSGKSTLIKLLSGFYRADPGTQIEIDGTALRMPISPRELLNRGLAFVHQDLGLDLDANVIENVRVGRYSPHPFTRWIRWRAEARGVASALHQIGADSVCPYASLRTLRHAQRASVAIARAIQGIDLGEGLIVFDESTQSLPRDILHEFYAQVRRIAASGTSVLIVSHRLDEVLALCDTITVLEDGRATVQNAPTKGMSEADLTRLILGASASASEGSKTKKPGVKDHTPSPGATVLDVRGLVGHGLSGADFTLRAGEVVGVIGTGDSGYDALPYLLGGSRPAMAGTVRILDTEFNPPSLTTRSAIAAGLVLVPADRGGQGIARELSALENLTLPRVTKKSTPLGIGRRWQLTEFQQAVLSLGVTPARPDYAAGSFSGGNQQKILLAKWLLNAPKVLVVHEPTQAVDVGARDEILREIRRQAATGVGVLVCSLETADLAGVCDRVLVVRGGRIARELSGHELTVHNLIDAVYIGTSSEIDHVNA